MVRYRQGPDILWFNDPAARVPREIAAWTGKAQRATPHKHAQAWNEKFLLAGKARVGRAGRQTDIPLRSRKMQAAWLLKGSAHGLEYAKKSKAKPNAR